MGARSYWLAAPLIGAGAALCVAVVLQAMPALGVGRSDPAGQVREAAALIAWGSPSELEHGEAMAREALRRSPLNSRALVVMAEARGRAGRPAEAEQVMRTATTLSHRDSSADLWLFDRALGQKRYDEAFLRADALLRRDELGNRPLLRLLYAAAHDPAALKPLAKRLALSPPWRLIFFDLLFAGQTSPSFAYPLFEAMREAGSPPTTHELESYLSLLAREGRYEQAYLTWLLSMSMEALGEMAYIHDGEFDGQRAAEPFGWKLSGNAGGAAAMEAAPDGGRALLVNTDGYTPGVFVAQLLVLPPGRYQLSGRVRAPANAEMADLAWVMACQPKNEPLMRVRVQPTGDAWRRFSAPFTVPPGCAGQLLSLITEAGERRTTMAIWYDDMAIRSAAEPEPAQGQP